MKLAHQIAAAIVGTSCMTAYSYTLSMLSGRQYREPVLLSHLLSKFPGEPKRYTTRKKATAWLIHYGVGLVFSLAYRNSHMKGTSGEAGAKGLLLGAGFGCLGVAGWQLAFTLHPHPPKIKKTGYLLHLLPAHLIYGGCLGLAANFMAEREY